MHEMALAEGILGVALDVGEGRPVKRIQLRIGALQHVTPDSLRFCFQLVAENTPAASAVLDLEPLPETGEEAFDRVAAGPADDVADEEDAHGRSGGL